jgi:uncharacterized lipoprotein YmbA
MARTVPKNTIVVEVSDFSKLSSTERTAATNFMTAVAAQIVANGSTYKKTVVFAHPPKGTKNVPTNTVVVTVSNFSSKLSSTDRTAATNWLTAVIADVVANGAKQKNKSTFIYPPKG